MIKNILLFPHSAGRKLMGVRNTPYILKEIMKRQRNNSFKFQSDELNCPINNKLVLKSNAVYCKSIHKKRTSNGAHGRSIDHIERGQNKTIDNKMHIMRVSCSND